MVQPTIPTGKDKEANNHKVSDNNNIKTMTTTAVTAAIVWTKCCYRNKASTAKSTAAPAF